MARSPRHRDTASSVSEVLGNADDALSALLRHARSLARADSLLAAHAGPDAAAQFQVAAMRRDRLVLLTPSASWATRLRMQAEQMLGILQTSGYEHLRHIDIRVAPLAREPVAGKNRKPLSAAAKLAFSLMSRMSNDPGADSNN